MMHRLLPIASSCLAALALSALVGCGDDAPPATDDGGAGDGAAGDGGNAADASIGPDAPPPPPDAAPGPDAVPIDDTCSGMALPTTAPNPLTIGGTVSAASTMGGTYAADVLVEARRRSDRSVLATATSGVDGLFSITYSDGTANPTQPALDGYLHLTKAGYVPGNLFPPEPLYRDQSTLDVQIFDMMTISLLPLLTGVNQCPGDYGYVGILVVDCDGNPVPDAVVTLTPASDDSMCPTRVIYTNDMSLPDTSRTATGASGLALIFNAPSDAGSITVNTVRGGTSLHTHTIDVFPGEFTLTVVHP